MQELARQRDHRQLVDMIARLSEQVRNPGHFITTEPLQQGEPLLQVSHEVLLHDALGAQCMADASHRSRGTARFTPCGTTLTDQIIGL